MKKVLTIIFVSIIAVTLTGCGCSKKNEVDNSNINIDSKINFTNNFIESTNNLISFKNNTGYTDIQCSGIAMNNANNKSRISWNGTDWIANINNNDYRIITTKTMDDFNVYGANIVMQKSAPTNVINEDTYWFEVVGE